MAVSNAQPGDFVLEVASLGQEVVASFTRLITRRKIQDPERRMESILATVSITASILTELGTTINKHSTEVYIEDEVTRPTCEACKTDLSKLLVISKEAGERGLWFREGTLAGKNVTAEVDPWFLFNVGLGGPIQCVEFFNRLETTRYSLVAFRDTVKYKILKVLKEQNLLSSEQAEEFKLLTALLPQLVMAIDYAEQFKKDRLELENEKAKRENFLKSSRNRPDVGRKDGLPLSNDDQDDSDAESQLTATEPMQDLKKSVRFSRDDDRRSLYSVDSFEERRLPDTQEFLEEWRLRWDAEKRDIRHSSSFLGLKIKRYFEEPGRWALDAELRSQKELKNSLDSMISATSEAKHIASVHKVIRALPYEAREEIESLLEGREKNTSNHKVTRQWTVVAIRPRIKYHFGGEGWFKTAKSQDWIVMIKGQTLERLDRKRPFITEDPWRKERRRDVRHHSRMIEDEYYDEWNAPRRNPSRHTRPTSHPPYEEDYRPHRAPRHVEHGGFQPGTILVGDVAGHDEAEKRMDEILTDLPNRFTM